MIANALPVMRAFSLLAVDTAMRRGELGGLVWEDLDLRRRVATVRTILEHRDDLVEATRDCTKVPHGAFTRTFGDGPLASTLGAAGFNRHLLHHWEPQVSYTRLRELEAFLMRTDVAPILERRRSTYVGTFVLLLRASRSRVTA